MAQQRTPYWRKQDEAIDRPRWLATRRSPVTRLAPLPQRHTWAATTGRSQMTVTVCSRNAIVIMHNATVVGAARGLARPLSSGSGPFGRMGRQQGPLLPTLSALACARSRGGAPGQPAQWG